MKQVPPRHVFSDEEHLVRHDGGSYKLNHIGVPGVVGAGGGGVSKRGWMYQGDGCIKGVEVYKLVVIRYRGGGGVYERQWI